MGCVRHADRKDRFATGKWGAVRNNSRLPVDHSGLGLRVGPTTPSTSDRTSGACPPNSLAVSQHKSGRESESGALSVVREANDVLRSEATQRGSFLDRSQTDRNALLDNEITSTQTKELCKFFQMLDRWDRGVSQ
jgi:hypothetical protein